MPMEAATESHEVDMAGIRNLDAVSSVTASSSQIWLCLARGGNCWRASALFLDLHAHTANSA